MKTYNTPVLIVGGGPVGLTLSLDLGWRNIGNILIEQDEREARQQHPRMDMVSLRTMEYCRRWGIVADVEQAGFPRDFEQSIVFSSGVLGKELARKLYPKGKDFKPYRWSPQHPELCPQNFFDPVFQKAAESYPDTQILYRHRLISIDQDANGVTALVENVNSGEELQIQAKYLAACDGANSYTGRQIGIYPPKDCLLCYSTNIFVRCPDLVDRTADFRAYRYILMDANGIWGSIVNMNGADIWRVQILGDKTWPQWQEEELHPYIRKAIGQEIPYEFLSFIPWSRREYVTETYRNQRCFLVGDAAHQLSPTGGYGMNTGISEAMDLSWKLAAMIEGWGGETLLDSYEIERRPVAVRTVQQSSKNLNVHYSMSSILSKQGLFDDTPEGAVLRKETGAEIHQLMQPEYDSVGIHLGAIYHKSPIIVELEDDKGEMTDVVDYEQSAQAGARAPHVWLGENKSTLDLYGRGFTLVEFADTESDWSELKNTAKSIGVPIRRELVIQLEARKVYEKRFVLVRPDGHIAWRDDILMNDPLAVLSRVTGNESFAKSTLQLSNSN